VNQVERGMSIALAASLLSNAPRTGLRLGACLMAGSRLLSIGANKWSTHPASDNNDVFCRSLHAEHCALLRRQHYDAPSRMTLYVARKREDGTVGCSKPCANCMALARLAGVRRIWFYDQNGQSKEALL
jgi:deoxycytidylate deaminase